MIIQKVSKLSFYDSLASWIRGESIEDGIATGEGEGSTLDGEGRFLVELKEVEESFVGEDRVVVDVSVREELCVHAARN